MAKNAPDATQDALLDYIAECDRMFICSDEPTNYTAASTTYMLASFTLDSGDFAKAAGAPSGRKLTIAAQNGGSVTNSGEADHIALCKSGDTTLRFVTTCDAQQLVSGAALNVPAWDITVPDPV